MTGKFEQFSIRFNQRLTRGWRGLKMLSAGLIVVAVVNALQAQFWI